MAINFHAIQALDAGTSYAGSNGSTGVSDHPAKGHEKFIHYVIFPCAHPFQQTMLHVVLQNQQRGLAKG
jgi:hypothetical protein